MTQVVRPDEFRSDAEISDGDAAVTIRVEDEISNLKTVIVHRPGAEMERLTPPNHKELLFDDLLSPRQAQDEHERFTELMRANGIQVLEFMDLFRSALEDPAAREFVLENTFNWKRLGPLMSPHLREWAGGLSPAELASLCIEGITKKEWADIHSGPSLVAQSLSDDDFLVGPLPNHLFTRDSSVWAYGGVAISSMNREARRRESLHYRTIYNYHPAFKNAQFNVWTQGQAGSTRSVEGGDILVLGDGLLTVGISERTTPQGVEHLAMELFSAGRADRVLAIMLPKSREFMHLDTVLTQLDKDMFTLYPGARQLETVLLEKTEDGASVTELSRDTRDSIQRVLGRSVRFVAPDASDAELSREQWNDGFNMLALRPGTVVSYDRTPLSNAAMRDAGIEVLEINGSELGRGRGGPRCMSCPIERA
ncbi:arginine deiminase [Actinomycetaceae bacterium MB13-C1-2]|nr:arginine deiminase [Actinomycetaceae bacterium MB13-C1-2]